MQRVMSVKELREALGRMPDGLVYVAVNGEDLPIVGCQRIEGDEAFECLLFVAEEEWVEA